MKFKCRMTEEELRQKCLELLEGKKRFAWFPVEVSRGDCRWLEQVSFKVDWPNGYSYYKEKLIQISNPNHDPVKEKDFSRKHPIEHRVPNPYRETIYKTIYLPNKEALDRMNGNTLEGFYAVLRGDFKIYKD